jgi:hypothetical protein
MRTFTQALAIAGCMIFLTTQTPANAAVVLDQEYLPPPGAPSGGNAVSRNSPTSINAAGQTFTVGVTGTLSSIVVEIVKSSAAIIADLVLDLRTPDGALPGLPGATLASVAVAGTDITTGTSLVSFDLSGAGISVTSGDFLSFVLTSDTLHAGPGPYFANNSGVGGGYSGGEGYRTTLGDGTNFVSTLDYRFQTFVDTAVPEAGSFFLLAASLAGLRLVRRRARRA